MQDREFRLSPTRAWMRLSGLAVAAAKGVYRQPVIRAAGAYRRVLRGTTFVGITGSVGKTTTKDLAFRALASRFPVVRSHLSNNDLYNTARTLVTTPPWARACIQELGVDAPGSIDAPLALLRPQVAVVTAIGLDHLRAFRTHEAIAAEKSKLVSALPATGTAVLNADDPYVEPMAALCRGRVVRFGQARGADLRILGIDAAWPGGLSLRLQWRDAEEGHVVTALQGAHLATSLAAAIATAVTVGLPLAAACEALHGAEPTTGRLSVARTRDGVQWLRDDFKASAWSVGQAFDHLAGCRDGVARRVIVLGTIADRRGKSRDAYLKVLAHAVRCADRVVLVGEHAHYADDARRRHPEADLRGFATLQAASEALREDLRPGDLVLLKGGMKDHLSRLMLARERAVACWPNRCGRMEDCGACRLLGVPTRHDGTPA